ncbi:TPA: hypothetical protein ONA81_005820 [Pseudomonas aeruginosa]|nr:hypothetical protein [Pseudomonas aeruginosa]HCR1237624.1 hypothetical protein [Pseudomonas aeruginosa]HCR1382379.1 hypothetical protein [Pseudomonas aeruginosa]HCR1589831.1 hypothetical protein [Pseudomonas aeruginosa]
MKNSQRSAVDARCRDEQLPRTSHPAGRSGQQVARRVQRDEELSEREADHGATGRHVMKNSQRPAFLPVARVMKNSHRTRRDPPPGVMKNSHASQLPAGVATSTKACRRAGHRRLQHARRRDEELPSTRSVGRLQGSHGGRPGELDTGHRSPLHNNNKMRIIIIMLFPPWS